MEAKPYHSVTRFLHHLYPDCEVGSQIAPKDWAAGTGSKPMCRLCYERKKTAEAQLKTTEAQETYKPKAVH